MSGPFRASGRVVVTGVGALSPLGVGVDIFWPRMLAGESGIDSISTMDLSAYPTKIGGEVRDFDPENYLDRKEARKVDRFIAFAVAVSGMALADAKVDLDPIRDHVGVLIGSGIGGLTVLSQQFRRLFEGGPSKVSPFLVPYMIPDMASGFVSIVNQLRGPNTSVVSACSTGADAVGQAYHMVKRGDAIAMVCGGAEAPINEIAMAGFCAARAMSNRNDEPERASRPFDLNRDGFVMSEGAGVLFIEDYDHAVARGARIYGEIVGYGMTGDAYHITAPDPEARGACRAMEIAMSQAGVQPNQIDYINAHGTSTQLNDRTESLAVKKTFGEFAYDVSISSTKSMIGHTLGAAGSLEAIFCLLAMRDGAIPPTINYETPDPDCDLNYTPNNSVQKPVNITLSNSFGFGGHNVSLIFRKV